MGPFVTRVELGRYQCALIAILQVKLSKRSHVEYSAAQSTISERSKGSCPTINGAQHYTLYCFILPMSSIEVLNEMVIRGVLRSQFSQRRRLVIRISLVPKLI